MIFEAGEVAELLSKVIKEKKIDLLVMSAHGHTTAPNALIGSTAERILHQVFCPVLTVGPGVVSQPANASELSRILYGVDFSVASLAAVPFVISLACASRAQLILLHCIGPHDENLNQLRHALADLIPFGVELRTEPDCIVERGHPSEKILEVAEGHGADLIVLGIRSAKRDVSRAQNLFRPGVLKIVTEAKCPVLTICGS
jgi:nucleotide-binding universal stress UspA family protein